MDTYLDFTRKALSMLNIGYLQSDDLDSLLSKLRISVVFPANTIEGEILVLSRKLADAIETKNDFTYIEQLLDQISNKIAENLFD